MVFIYKLFFCFVLSIFKKLHAAGFFLKLSLNGDTERFSIECEPIAGFWNSFVIILQHLINVDCQVTFWNGFEVLLVFLFGKRKNLDFTKDEANIISNLTLVFLLITRYW